MADRRVVIRVVQVLLGLLVIGLAARTLVLNWAEFRAQSISWQFSFGWIAASLGIVFAMYAVLIEAWRRVVIGMGQQLGFVAAARIWALASLGKYIPGKVWAIAGAAAMARDAGVDPKAAVTSAVVLQALAVASGLVITAVAAPQALAGSGQGILFVVATLAVMTVGAFAMPRLRVGPLALAFLANCVAWIGYGAAFLLLARGTLPGAVLTWEQAAGVFAGSYVAGLLALFAPGGIGPRESVLVLLLTPALGPKVALALAVVSRLQLTITEVGVAVPFLAGVGRSPRTTAAG